MEQQLAEVRSSTDERMKQAEQFVQDSQDGWQSADKRARQAEKRASELEKTIASFQKQQQVDRIDQLRPEAPPVGNSSTPVDEQMEESIGGKSKESERNGNGHLNDDDVDMDMIEVTKCSAAILCAHLFHRDTLKNRSITPFRNPCNLVDLREEQLLDEVLNQEQQINLIIKHWSV